MLGEGGGKGKGGIRRGHRYWVTMEARVELGINYFNCALLMCGIAIIACGRLRPLEGINRHLPQFPAHVMPRLAGYCSRVCCGSLHLCPWTGLRNATSSSTSVSFLGIGRARTFPPFFHLFSGRCSRMTLGLGLCHLTVTILCSFIQSSQVG
jgi:hypothetical protein